MLVFFVWVSWFMLLFHVIGDVFRRRDASGVNKTLWLIFVIFLPFLGVFAYLIANSDDMARRNLERRSRQSDMDDYVRSVAAPAARRPRSRRAKALLDSDAITQEEFDAIKAKALG